MDEQKGGPMYKTARVAREQFEKGPTWSNPDLQRHVSHFLEAIFGCDGTDSVRREVDGWIDPVFMTVPRLGVHRRWDRLGSNATFGAWLVGKRAKGGNHALLADRVEEDAACFVLSFATSLISRLESDIDFFWACELFNPELQPSLEFAVAKQKLVRIGQAFPDLVSAQTYTAMEAYFDLPIPQKLLTAYKSEEITLTEFFNRMDGLSTRFHPFTRLARAISSILPAQVVCETAISRWNDAKTKKRARMKDDVLTAYESFRELPNFHAVAKDIDLVGKFVP
jgi:hypothetical protein